MTTESVRLSATVPRHILEEADKIAAQHNLSRSQLISNCLLELVEKQKKELLAEGYKAMAQEHESFAALSESASREVQPEW